MENFLEEFRYAYKDSIETPISCEVCHDRCPNWYRGYDLQPRYRWCL